MRTVGVVVNPIAGMGGRVGLKGTDGLVEEARARGADPRAPERAEAALRALATHAGADGHGGEAVHVLTWGDGMGEDAARAAGLDPAVLGVPDGPETTAADTRDAVRAFVERGVDLVLFVGGDGTAVDVADALESAGALDPGDGGVPVLGVPAGVKVFSAVFAVRPEAAGRIAATFEATERAEVSDLDEAAYREGEVRSRLHAVVPVPVAETRQAGKQVARADVEGVVAAVAEDVRAHPETTSVFGPGGTVGAIEEALGVDGSPLGVDVYRGDRLLVRDGGARDVEAAVGVGETAGTAVAAGEAASEDDRVVIVVSPVGGQGFLFGRGNLQLSPAVIRRADEISVVASRRKLDDVGVLRVDTGDPALDEDLRGWHRIRTGRVEERLVEVR
ncbi:MAG: ATP-NAD kinase family protein [Halobacteriaceae archaeon]